MREQIIESIKKEKIIVIVRGIKKENITDLAEAMYAGGIRLLELTYSADGSVTDEETASCIQMLSKHFEGRMHIGAGTVICPEQVELTKNAGGKFIISPDTNEQVIKKTRELGLVSMPGALTPTEIQAAHTYGADFVKLFPVSNLGADYVKAVSAPLSHISILAVGGISLDNMSEYLRAGVSGFGLGSNIVNKRMVENGDFEGITKLAQSYVSKVREG